MSAQPSITLSLPSARQVLLACLGLLEEPRQPSSKTGVAETIRQMGALQIDTIHVVARAPYFTLWSRLGDYDVKWLDELLAEGDLFEYWAHAACFLPIEDYPFFRRYMLNGLRVWGNQQQWLEDHQDLVAMIHNRLREEGPLRSSDFEHNSHRSNGWWDWKVEKIALELLFNTGELMISRREKFQRIYDLQERVLPDWDDTRTPSYEETVEALVLKTVHTLGVALPAWIPDYYRLKKTGLAQILDRLVDAGVLFPVKIDGFTQNAYAHVGRLDLLQKAAAGLLHPQRTVLLSPFDPLVWDRARAKSLFNFDFSLECYLPQAKRRFGYFLLPILHRDRLVGRLDAKAHRKDGIFEVKSLYLEPDVDVDAGLLAGLRNTLLACANWHGVPHVRIVNSEPLSLVAQLNF